MVYIQNNEMNSFPKSNNTQELICCGLLLIESGKTKPQGIEERNCLIRNWLRLLKKKLQLPKEL